MKRTLITLTFACLACGTALADEPTVALTRSELEAVVRAQVAATAAQQAAQEAAPTMEKVRKALMPAPVEPAPPK